MNSSSFINISVFGSTARGSDDSNSDLDILAVVRDGAGTQSVTQIDQWALTEHRKKPSISWYGEKKVSHFFESGDLFAWHLFLESKPIMGFDGIPEIFGKPAPFRDAKNTIDELIEILEEIPCNLERSPQNSVFEAGVMYVCLRNIGMAASWHLSPKLDFSRDSPYTIPSNPLPIPLVTYERFALCRISGQRGRVAPDVSERELIRWLPHGSMWAKNIRREIR